jgi:hypothetical protein
MLSPQFKIGLTIVLFLALSAYHLTNIFVAELRSDWLSLGKLGQLAITTAGFYLVFGSQVFARVVLLVSRTQYIGGIYKGTSHKISKSADGALTYSNKHENSFEIHHSFLQTTIAGISYEGEKGYSSLSGSLFDRKGNDYFFALRLESLYGEYGVLKVSVDGKKVTGVYWSGDNIKPGQFDLMATRT